MKRREFITLLGGAGAAWPFAAHAQQPIPVVGFLRSTPAAPFQNLVTAFSQGLKEAGFIDGQNVVVEFRWAENRADRLPALVADLLRRPVAVIAGDNISITAAKAATKAVPIVFAIGGDPVAQGLVASLNRPGGNVTGVTFFSGELGSKRLELLRQVAAKPTTIGVLVTPDTPTTEVERRDVQAAALAIGQPLILVDTRSRRDIENAFETFVQRQVGALLIGSGTFLNSHSEGIVALAARHALPAMFYQREQVVAGGLMSYGTSITDAYRQAGVVSGRILNGAAPADLPVMRATKFELVLNLKTAKVLGLEIPPTLLALADEVIE